MAKYGPDDLQVKVSTASTTGSFRDVTQNLIEFSGFDVEAILEQSNTFGDTFEEHSFVGVTRLPEMTFTFFYDDDTSTGTGGVFGTETAVGQERVFRLNFTNTTGSTGAGTNIKVDALLHSVKRQPGRGVLSKMQVMAQPTGSWAAVSTT